MQLPTICPNCSGSKVLLYFDSVYFYLVCDRCGMSGSRALSEEDAVNVWNERGDTTFTYEVVQDTSKLVKTLSCESQRASERFAINWPVVIALSSPTGRKVTGVMRNISPYGAFLHLRGGNLSEIPNTVEELSEKRMYMYYKNPPVPSENGESEAGENKLANTIQQVELVPRHLLQNSQIIGIGGNFKSPNSEQLESVEGLVKFARSK